MSIFRALEGLVGLGVFGSVAALGLGTIAAGPWMDEAILGQDMHLTVYGPRPYAFQQTMPVIEVEPAQARARLERSGVPESAAPGVWFMPWQVTYAHRWERQVAVPIINGKLHQPTEPVCGYAVRVAASAFDSDQSPGLQDMVTRKLRVMFQDINKRLSNDDHSFRFHKVENTQLKFSLGRDEATVRVQVNMGRDESLSARFKIRTRVVAGQLSFALQGSPEVVRSPALQRRMEKSAYQDHPFLCRLGWLINACEGIAASKMEEEGAAGIEKFVKQLSTSVGQLSDITDPFPDRHGDRLAITVQDGPVLSPEGLDLRFCVAATLAPPLRDEAIPGFASLGTPPPRFEEALQASRPTLELAASLDGLNQLLFLTWQSGLLGRLGSSSPVLEALPEEVRSLAFEVKGLDPAMPPFLTWRQPGGQPRDGFWTLTLAGVELGTWGARQVIGHSHLVVRAEGHQGVLSFEGRLVNPVVQCQERMASSWKLTPCLSDLLPAVRETLGDRPLSKNFDAAAVLTSLLEQVDPAVLVNTNDIHIEMKPTGATLRVDLRLRSR